MNVPFQRPQIGTAIASLLNYKGGSIPVDFETGVKAVAQLVDVWNSPYLEYAIPVAGGAELLAASIGAGNFGVVAVRPAAAVVLQVRQISFQNNSGGVVAFLARRWRAADILAYNGAALIATSQLASMAAKSVGASSTTQVGSTVVTTRRLAADPQTGQPLPGRYYIPNGSSTIVTLPEPGVFLFGNDENGLPAYGIECGGANTEVLISFVCREWPLPG